MLHTVVLIARNELADSARSRRVMVMVLLYFLGAMAASAMFISGLHHIEGELAKSLGLTAASGGEGLTTLLWKSNRFREIMTRLVGDKALAETLLAVPPLALFYGWLSCAFTPLLVMLTSSARIAEEISTGSARFLMFRTARAHWCLGKFLGQALQIFGALLLSALGAWLIGLLRMKSFEPGPTAAYMFWFALKAWLYALPFLGLALAISQFFTSPNLALACGFVMLVVLSVLTRLTGWLAGEGWRQIWHVIKALTPGAHRQALWWNDATHLLPAAAILLVLSAAYLAAGYARFARRDL
jgi:ABC-type transport system involved in multi-copper enzyme maturation permease subunit